jgi:hypothetical protein
LRTSIVPLATLVATILQGQVGVDFRPAALPAFPQSDVVFFTRHELAPPPPGLTWSENAGGEKVHGLIMNGSVTAAPDVVVGVKTVAEPPLQKGGEFCGGVTASGKVVHRLLVDQKSDSYFGYDLVLESGDMIRGYRVSFRSLSNGEEMRHGCKRSKPLRLMPPSKYPPSQIVHEGETIALDVLVSADGQQKIVDYLRIVPASGDPQPAASAAPARDMTVDDERPVVAPESFLRTAFFVNGQKSDARVGFSAGSGAVMWLYVPEHGRYIMALSPHAGFEKAGEIRDNTVFLRDGDQRYELRLAGPITGPGNAWNLYIRHDPHYWPRPAQTDAVILGFGRMELLLPKQ